MPVTYPIPPGVHALPPSSLDLCPDSEIDDILLHPPPVTSTKNIWFFWNTGYTTLHPYLKRNIRAWHRRFAPNWTIRVLDVAPNSALHISNFLDTTDSTLFPRAFTEGTLTGTYAPQHTSDLARFPLLLRYGGIYADTGFMQIGDLDALWNATVGDPASPFEVLSYNSGGPQNRSLTNYFMGSLPENPFFARCHALLLALWAEDGGKTSTKGMCDSALLRGVPHMGKTFGLPAIVGDDGEHLDSEAVGRLLTDYIIQGQAMTMVCGIVDEEGEWDGPRYCAEHVFAIDYMVGSQLINEMTAWDGEKAFRLMSLRIPGEGEKESEDQKQAREIVEGCLSRSFGFKLAHGLIIKVLGQTLGSLWRANEGSDDVEGTYAHWLRYGMVHWCPEKLPPREEWKVEEPIKRGFLLRES